MTPQPNRPLTAEDVGLLKRGDVLRLADGWELDFPTHAGGPTTVEDIDPEDDMITVRTHEGLVDHFDFETMEGLFAFVERPVAARPALSAGGGDIRTLRVLLDNLVIAQSLSREIRQQTTDEARAYLYNTRAALAPREEAPAEAGEKDRRIADLLEANNRYLARARDAEAELAALRARSSGSAAEAVAWRMRSENTRWEYGPDRPVYGDENGADGWTVQPLYTHPAADPDNLRVAREALAAVVIADDHRPRSRVTPSDWIRNSYAPAIAHARKALAALNAEGL